MCPISSARRPSTSPVRCVARKNTASRSSARYSFNRNPLVMRSTQSWLVKRSRYCRMGLPTPKMRTKMSGRCRKRMVSTTAEALTR